MNTNSGDNRHSGATDGYVDLECPFCGKRAGLAEPHSVMCESCSGRGPVGHDSDHATELWGMRSAHRLRDGCDRLEMEITLGNYIHWQDRKWWLFRHDGEGLQSGATLIELIESLAT
jgi:hypothetical protein